MSRQQQQLPFGYLSQIDSYLSAVQSVTAQPSSSSPASSSSLLQPSLSSATTTILDASSSSLPDCFRTLRCDNEILFDEAGADEPRWTFPCGHVYCVECVRRAHATAHRTNVHVFCHRCANIIVRKRDNVPCAHQIPAVAFHVRKPLTEDNNGLPDRYSLALGQRTGPRCQLCWLVSRLQNLTYQIGQKYNLGGASGSGEKTFDGELFACVQVDRQRIVHGLRNELPSAAVDAVDDVELHQTPDIRQELNQTASDICGGLGQVPMEPNFDPRGHIVVQYRLRGFTTWMRENGLDAASLPPGLRAAVYGDFGF